MMTLISMIWYAFLATLIMWLVTSGDSGRCLIFAAGFATATAGMVFMVVVASIQINHGEDDG